MVSPVGKLVLAHLPLHGVLTDSRGWLQWAQHRSLAATKVLHAGVDLKRFSPPTDHEKTECRRQLAIGGDKPLILHVGHINSERSLDVLGELAMVGTWEVGIVASTSTQVDQKLLRNLKASGCHVIHKFLSNIADAYKAADCYVFPTHGSTGAIQTPLSVLEACAVNLPVVSAPFGSLPDFLSEGNGMFFVKQPGFEAYKAAVERALSEPSLTRSKIVDLTWDTFASKIGNVYEELLNH